MSRGNADRHGVPPPGRRRNILGKGRRVIERRGGVTVQVVVGRAASGHVENSRSRSARQGTMVSIAPAWYQPFAALAALELSLVHHDVFEESLVVELGVGQAAR